MPKSTEQECLWRLSVLAGVLAHHNERGVTVGGLRRGLGCVLSGCLHQLADDGLLIQIGERWVPADGVSLDVEI
jgi:hypothetical protein